MTVSVEIKWDEELIKKFDKLGEKDLINARNKWLKESVIILQWEAKKLAPVDNGLLRKNILASVYDDHAVIYNNLYYAEFVHEWTKPHIIMPKFKKSLHWIDSKTNEDRFAKLVHHPWYKWNPFFTKAVENKKSQILQRFYEIINEYIND